MNTPENSLRRLGFADAGAVHALETLVFSKEAWSLSQIEEELRSPWSTYLGLFEGDDLVGYTGAKGDIEGDVMTVAVHPGKRGVGLGSTLIKELLSVVSRAGMRTLFLEVRESNEAARNLYRAHGFADIGVVPAYYRFPTEDAVTMRRHLK